MIRGLSAAEISRMHDVIRPYIRRTPLLDANGGDVGLDRLDEQVVVVLCGGNTGRHGPH